jgi:putative ABC transport system permease protein
MFDIDKWQEILGTMRKNKLRTLLTMFGVFWGIFMLMILMGSGNGLENGVNNEFKGWATNSGFVWSNRTTMPYKGLQPGRYIRFENRDRETLTSTVDDLEHLAPRLNLWGNDNNITREDKAGSFRVYGDYPEYQKVQIVDVIEGRHLNHLDIQDRRKVAVIGNYVRNVLFDEDEEAVGDYIKINGLYFSSCWSVSNQNEKVSRPKGMNKAFTPLSQPFSKPFNMATALVGLHSLPSRGLPLHRWRKV